MAIKNDLDIDAVEFLQRLEIRNVDEHSEEEVAF